MGALVRENLILTGIMMIKEAKMEEGTLPIPRTGIVHGK